MGCLFGRQTRTRFSGIPERLDSNNESAVLSTELPLCNCTTYVFTRLNRFLSVFLLLFCFRDLIFSLVAPEMLLELCLSRIWNYRKWFVYFVGDCIVVAVVVIVIVVSFAFRNISLSLSFWASSLGLSLYFCLLSDHFKLDRRSSGTGESMKEKSNNRHALCCVWYQNSL